jgi:hypothetical protein
MLHGSSSRYPAANRNLPQNPLDNPPGVGDHASFGLGRHVVHAFPALTGPNAMPSIRPLPKTPIRIVNGRIAIGVAMDGAIGILHGVAGIRDGAQHAPDVSSRHGFLAGADLRFHIIVEAPNKMGTVYSF